MDFLANVRAAIADKFVGDSEGAFLKLEEPKETAKCRVIYLSTRRLSVQPLLIQLDLEEKGVDIHPLFKGSNESGLKKRCDYVIVCPHEDKVYVLVAELKSDKPGEWYNQCVAGECLVHYALSTVDRVHGTNYRASFEYRHILFTSNAHLVHKRGTGNNPIKYRHRPQSDTYFTIQRCNNTTSDGYPLKNFLVAR